jgi:hypothetical protein
MKLGADRKKLGILLALLAAAGYLLYTNVFSSPGPTPSSAARPTRPTATSPASISSSTPQSAPAGRAATGRRSAQEFRPSYKPRNAPTDLSTIDPKLRLDLLAKVQGVDAGAAARNLFQFGAAAVPALGVKEPQKIIPKTPEEIAREVAAQAPPGPPAPPPPPPITLKYYGYAAQRADGRKRAFFLDGDEIFVAAEGEMVKRRYKVVRIGVNSVVMEDTQFSNTQTLPLQEEAAG